MKLGDLKLEGPCALGDPTVTLEGLVVEVEMRGEGQAFLAQKNVHYGVDRIVAILPGGRGYVWHQLNNCGELAYDGTQIGEDCPPLEDQ